MAKPKNDPLGRYARLYHEVANSPAWVALGPSPKALYVDLSLQFNGSNNGNLTAALGDLKHRGWRSSATLAAALSDLMVLGFIVRTRAGGVERGSRVCSLYALSHLPIPDLPKYGVERAAPSFGYRLFSSVSEARRALSEARRRGRQKKTTLQNLNANASDSEAVGGFSNSDSEAVEARSASEIEAGKNRRNRLQTCASAGFR
jgi:hypothetical protein